MRKPRERKVCMENNQFKLRIEKDIHKDNTSYYIDYGKRKDQEEWIINLLEDFAEDKSGLLVIDSDYFYYKNRNAESITEEIKKELDQLGMHYREMITKKEADETILGIRMRNGKKVNCSKIGLAVTSQQLKSLGRVWNYNLFYYIAPEGLDPEGLLKQFYDDRGEYDELTEHFGIYFYHDCFFNRLRISCREPYIGFTEGKLKKYS
jgi:hypothetical protein